MLRAIENPFRGGILLTLDWDGAGRPRPIQCTRTAGSWPFVTKAEHQRANPDLGFENFQPLRTHQAALARRPALPVSAAGRTMLYGATPPAGRAGPARYDLTTADMPSAAKELLGSLGPEYLAPIDVQSVGFWKGDPRCLAPSNPLASA